jgi:hypothetical protein
MATQPALYQIGESMDRNKELINEAEYLHFSIFGKPAPKEIFRLYIKVHDHYFRDESKAEKEVLKKMWTHNLPLEPLEFACRKRCPIISRKVGVMIYLVEAFVGYEENFSAEHRSFPGVMAAMTWAVMRTPWVWGRGWLIVILHGII